MPGIQQPQSTAEGRGLLTGLAEAEPAQGVAAAPGQHRHPPQHAARPPRRLPQTHRRHQEAEQESGSNLRRFPIKMSQISLMPSCLAGPSRLCHCRSRPRGCRPGSRGATRPSRRRRRSRHACRPSSRRGGRNRSRRNRARRCGRGGRSAACPWTRRAASTSRST